MLAENNKVAELWTQDNCVYCGMAKAILKSRNYIVIEQKLGSNVTKEDLLSKVPHAKSLPQIFINDRYIGGYPELKEYLRA